MLKSLFLCILAISNQTDAALHVLYENQPKATQIVKCEWEEDSFYYTEKNPSIVFSQYNKSSNVLQNTYNFAFRSFQTGYKNIP